MFKKLTKPLIATALIASGLAAVSASANGVSFMVVDGHATVRSSSPIAVTRYAPGGVATMLNVDCEVAGTPVEFPNDIKIWSTSGIMAGTLLAWNVPGSTFEGLLEMPELAPNQAAFISNALPGGLPAGTPCEVALQ